jgi:hypothetical protein
LYGFRQAERFFVNHGDLEQKQYISAQLLHGSISFSTEAVIFQRLFKSGRVRAVFWLLYWRH